MTSTDLHRLAVRFCDGDAMTRDIADDNARYLRLFLSKFLEFVKQEEGTTTAWHASYCRLHPNHTGHCSIRNHDNLVQFDLRKEGRDGIKGD